jgi:hypothetical protein
MSYFGSLSQLQNTGFATGSKEHCLKACPKKLGIIHLTWNEGREMGNYRSLGILR